MEWLFDALVVLSMLFLRLVAPILLLMIVGDLIRSRREGRAGQSEAGANAVSPAQPVQDLG